MAVEHEDISEDKSSTVDIYAQQAKTLRTHRQPPVKEVVTENLPSRRPWYLAHLQRVGVWMLVMFFLYLFLASVLAPIYTNGVNQWNYGQARISRCDYNVGHSGTSHFLAEYYQHQAVVIEIPEHHPERAKIYTLSMTIQGGDGPCIVTLAPAHVNLHGKAGYPDLIVQVEGFQLPAILYNTGTGFSQEQQP